jgi:hypothetical protein
VSDDDFELIGNKILEFLESTFKPESQSIFSNKTVNNFKSAVFGKTKKDPISTGIPAHSSETRASKIEIPEEFI